MSIFFLIIHIHIYYSSFIIRYLMLANNCTNLSIIKIVNNNGTNVRYTFVSFAFLVVRDGRGWRVRSEDSRGVTNFF
jgi:hypothetical protein